MFHLGHGGLLPLDGLAVVKAGPGNPAALVALTVMMAQAVIDRRRCGRDAAGAQPGLLVVMLIPFVTVALMGSLSLGSLSLWLAFAPMLKPACAQSKDDAATPDLTAACA